MFRLNNDMDNFSMFNMSYFVNLKQGISNDEFNKRHLKCAPPNCGGVEGKQCPKYLNLGVLSCVFHYRDMCNIIEI